MNGEWSLDGLYRGYDDPAFVRDRELIPEKLEKFHELTDALGKGADAASELHGYLEAAEEISILLNRMGQYLGLRQAACVTDQQAAGEQSHLMQLASSVTKDEAKASRYIASLPDLSAVIDSDPFLKDYEYYLKDKARQAKHLLSDEMEDLAARLDISGGWAWGNLQNYLTSGVTVEYDGKEMNLSAVRNLAYDRDPAVRKAAYEAELAAYPKIEDAVAFSLNNIKIQVNTLSDLRGYASPLDMTLEQSHLSRATLEVMLDAVRRYLPEFRRYLKAKARLLGHEDGLPWYDLFAPVGEDHSHFTAEEAGKYLVSHFASFAPDMAALVQQAFDEDWIDFYPRAGKSGGAFCAGAPFLKQSWILTNFDGTQGAVTTLAHELGHAYHNRMLEDNRVLNTDYSMPVAETASNFNELVILNAAMEEADEETRFSLLESQLEDTTQILCDIYSRYLFETAVFEGSKGGFLFAPQLKDLMLKAQEEAYGDGLDPRIRHPYMWICKSHYYSSGLSFYNFPYAFGGLFARGLYAKYKREGEAFLPKYRALLKATATADVEDAAKVAGVDLTRPAFWEESLDGIVSSIDAFIAMAEKRTGQDLSGKEP